MSFACQVEDPQVQVLGPGPPGPHTTDPAQVTPLIGVGVVPNKNRESVYSKNAYIQVKQCQYGTVRT